MQRQEPPQDRLKNDYEMLRPIGQGSYGSVGVYKSKRANDQQEYAVKIINIDKEQYSERFSREIQLIDSIGAHPHIVRVFRTYYQDLKNERIFSACIVMELANMSLRDLYHQFTYQMTELDIIDMMEQVVEALIALKEKEVFHRDLKPENVLVFWDGRADSKKLYKLTDFGCGKAQVHENQALIGHQVSYQFGTDSYWAPEFRYLFDSLPKTDEKSSKNDKKSMQNSYYPDYEKADVWTVAFIALEAYFTGDRKSDNKKRDFYQLNRQNMFDYLCEIVQKVKYPHLRRLIECALKKQCAVYRPAFYEYLQKIYAEKEKLILEMTCDTQLYQVHNRYSMNNQRVTAVAFARESHTTNNESHHYFASSSDQSIVTVRDARNDKYQRVIDKINVQCMAFSRDGTKLACSTGSKLVLVYDLTRAEGYAPSKLEGHEQCVTSVAFSHDTRYLASGSNDQTVRIWNAKGAWECLRTLEAHTTSEVSVAFTPEGQYLLSCSGDYQVVEVYAWRVEDDWKCEQIVNGTEKLMSHIAVSPNGQYFAYGMQQHDAQQQQHKISVWSLEQKQSDFEQNKRDFELTGHTKKVSSIAFSPDSEYLASGSADQRVILWRLRDRCLLNTLDAHADAVTCVAFSPCGEYLLTASTQVIVWKRNAPKFVLMEAEWKVARRLSPGDTRMHALASSADYAPQGANGDARVLAVDLWDATTQASVAQIQSQVQLRLVAPQRGQDGAIIAPIGESPYINNLGNEIGETYAIDQPYSFVAGGDDRNGAKLVLRQE